MPIYDLGYRRWEGELESFRTRGLVITETGIELAWKSRIVRRILMLAWAPALYFGVAFFAFEFFVENYRPGMITRELWSHEFLEDGLAMPPELVRLLEEDPVKARPKVWAYLLYHFFRAPQAMAIVILVGTIAAGLISSDVRTRSFVLYFSRPLTRVEYILGKAGVVSFYIALITTAPAIALYVLGVLLSPHLGVVVSTWDIPFRILGASIVLILPTTALALCLSSLTAESRYAAFSWFAVWILGWVGYAILGPTGKNWYVISFFHVLAEIQAGIFGIAQSMDSVAVSGAIAAGVFVICTLILFRRVSAPMRV